MQPIDPWRAALLCIKQHGEDAAIRAAQRADELLAKGDLEGSAVWRHVIRCIDELRRDKPAGRLN